MIKRKITVIFICLIVVLSFVGCDYDNSINVNVERDSTINGNTFGKSFLVLIGDKLYYDTTTRVVYWWNGYLGDGVYSSTTPSPYYAPNGLPYLYNPETNTFEEIKEE